MTHATKASEILAIHTKTNPSDHRQTPRLVKNVPPSHQNSKRPPPLVTSGTNLAAEQPPRSERINALAQPRRQATRSHPYSASDVSTKQILAVAKAHGLVFKCDLLSAVRMTSLAKIQKLSEVPARHPQKSKIAYGNHLETTSRCFDSPVNKRDMPSVLPVRPSLRITPSKVQFDSGPSSRRKNSGTVAAAKTDIMNTKLNNWTKITEKGDSADHRNTGESYSGRAADSSSHVLPQHNPQSLTPALTKLKNLDYIHRKNVLQSQPLKLVKTDGNGDILMSSEPLSGAMPLSDSSATSCAVATDKRSSDPDLAFMVETNITGRSNSARSVLQYERFVNNNSSHGLEEGGEEIFDNDSESSSESEEAPPTVRAFQRRMDASQAVTQKYSTVIKYHTDQGFRPLLCAFRNMQWRDFANRGRWHMFWANVCNARALFQPGQRYYFNDDQMVNHYQTCYHLSRKDNMTKNIKKFRNEMASQKDPIGKKDKHGNFLYLDLIAPTYLLPFDFNTFVDEFRKNGGLYIVKPCSGSQGQGIFLVNQMDQAKRWQERALAEIAACVQDNDPYQGYLISRYISNPLLIDGKKFDLRIYILVTSFKPLRCYYYRQGFCRFCATRYSPDIGNIDDKFMHLTNVAVQKQKKGYNRAHGNKWSIAAFRLYMERVHGRGKIDALFDRIFWMIVQSLRAVQGVMDNDRHCYEMYGYDCLIDAHLKPWLLEVNASPSLEDSTPVDRVIKTNLLQDTMRMALYERCPHLLGIKEKRADGSDMPLGDYEILYVEEPAPKLTPAERVKQAHLGRYGSTGGVVAQASGSGQDNKPRWNSM